MALVVAALLLGALGAKIPTNHEIEMRLETAIRAYLHPQRVEVRVERASPFSTTFQRIDITISGFTADGLPLDLTAPVPPDGDGAALPAPRRKARQILLETAVLRCTDFTVNHLRVQQLELTGTEVSLPLQAVSAGKFQITAAAAVTGAIQLRQEDLTAYLRTCELPITNPKVTLAPGECRISGDTRTLVRLPIQLTGEPAARQGAVLYLDNPHLRVSIVPVPAFIADRVLRDINPLADLNAAFNLPAPLSITRTTTTDGLLRFDGALLFPLPEK